MMKAKAGTLVKTTKARIGVPLGTVGLVVRVVADGTNESPTWRSEASGYSMDIPIAIVKHLSNGTERRYLFRDLEVAND
jgi:hypothetical protein